MPGVVGGKGAGLESSLKKLQQSGGLDATDADTVDELTLTEGGKKRGDAATDLNDGENSKGTAIKNDLHMSVEGYKTMGKRFAEAAIGLIRK